ncbi:helix-turn-helix domain-containing protein [Paenibacillus sp. R14(2021)]|uniref:helix-turn-helix domain-containing protein n=1 Tax=Paenibacillus sp. R14(2021) TaxID=2859228 RepID=UPI001C611ED9|nr:helix-turn-helix domain-containing protein [Paenibacillus sp. R14(2021)]
MSDLGALLKKAREQRNLSLDDIQELTKIRKRYLEAIEEGDYSVLPGSFYVRAFVKNYAEAVGLDADEVLRLYNKEIPSTVTEQQVIEPIQRPRRAQTQTSDRISRWGFRTLMWSFLLLIIVLVYIYAIKQPGKDHVDSADQTKMTDDTKPPATTPDKDTVKNGDGTSGNSNGSGTDNGKNTETEPPPEEQTPPVDQQPPPPAATTLTLDRTSGTTDYYNVSTGGTHKIELKATGHGWIGVNKTSRKGKSLISKNMEAGDTISLDVDGAVYVNLGRADYVEVTIDGVAIDDGNKVGGSRKMQLTPVEDPAKTTDTTNATTGQ